MFDDYSAPRFSSRKFRKNIIDKELYNKWKNSNDSYKEINFLTFKNYCYKILEAITNLISEERDGVRLPEGIGDIYLGYILYGNKKTNFSESKKYNLNVKFENWHTNGKSGKIIFGTKNRKYINHSSKLWSFVGSTNFKNLAHNSFLKNPERYKNSIERR